MKWPWRRAHVATPPSAEVSPDAAAERERIYADLHDDIGSKLLELMHGTEDARARELARLALEDLRDIVSRTRAVHGTLPQVLAMIREEVQRRMDARGLELAWDVDECLPEVDLSDGQALHLFRIFREAISNALRHGHPHRLRIRGRVIKGEFLADVTDDGPGMTPDAVGQGRGTTNIKTRAAALGGQAAWEPGTEGGTKVILRMPLLLESP